MDRRGIISEDQRRLVFTSVEPEISAARERFERLQQGASMNLYDELYSLTGEMEAASIDYAVCGGLALAIHGHPRFTKAIDLLVRSEDVERIVALLDRIGFILDSGTMPMGTDQIPLDIRRISRAVETELLTVDLLMVNPHFQDVWDDRDMVEWQGHQLQVVSARGLAKLKRFAGRKQDLADLERLGLGSEVNDGNS